MKKRASLAFAFALASLATSADAQPKKKPAKPAPPTGSAVAVTIVEVEGGNVYLKPGAAEGIRRGSRVTIDRREYVVTSSTTNHAMIEVGDTPAPAERATGTATVITQDEDHPKQLPPPRKLEELRGQWAAWHPPAESQHPKPVPLGLPDSNHRYDLTIYAFAGGVSALNDRGNGYARGELGLRMHIEPIARPLSFDLDGSAQGWLGPGVYDREGGRPTFRVRELQVGYGDRARWFAGLGRIRYAASTLGPLDGLRAQAPVSDHTTVSAFGGFLPDPGDGALRIDSQRFGTEVGYSNPEVKWRPEAALVVNGSTYDGKLDERRVAVVAGVYPGQSRIGAHVEASAFDKHNPWNVNPFELTAAGLDGRVSIGKYVQVGAHGEMRQQERSRYIATFLPASWFCQRALGPVPAAGPAPLTCDPRATTLYQAGVDGALTFDRFSLFAGGVASANPTRSDAPSQLGTFGTARLLRLLRVARIDVTGTASTGTYMDMFSFGGGPGVSLLADRLDASVYYRRNILDYRVGGTLNSDAVGGYVTLIPRPDFVVSLQGEGTDGHDYAAVMGAVALVWRPRF